MIEGQYDAGEINQEERHEAVTKLWDRATNEVGRRSERAPRRAQPDLHDGQLGCSRLVLADPAAGRDARPDGKPEGRDHRASDQGQLHGGPDRARVLHLDPRRPQGTCGHGAAHRRLRLPDPAAGRRGPGRDHPPGGLRHRGVHRDAGVQARGRPRDPAAASDRRAERQPDRADRRRGHHDQARSRDRREGQGDRSRRAGGPRRGVAGRHRQGHRGHDPGALGAQVRGSHRRLPGLLRPLDGHRQARPDRRRGRDHRRPVDRRAGHAADDADVPHRRRRRRGHHARSAARRGAVRGAQAQGPGEDRRGRRQGVDRGVRQGDHGRDHRRRRRGAPPHVPAPDAPVRRQRPEDRGRDAAQRGVAVPARAAGDPGPHGDRAVPGPGGPGGLQVPGRRHQRQAHRADRAPDDEEGPGRPEGRHRPAPGSVRRPLRLRADQRGGHRRRLARTPRPRRSSSGSPRRR